MRSVSPHFLSVCEFWAWPFRRPKASLVGNPCLLPAHSLSLVPFAEMISPLTLP